MSFPACWRAEYPQMGTLESEAPPTVEALAGQGKGVAGEWRLLLDHWKVLDPSLNPCRALEGWRRESSAGGGSGRDNRQTVGTVTWGKESAWLPLGLCVVGGRVLPAEAGRGRVPGRCTPITLSA